MIAHEVVAPHGRQIGFCVGEHHEISASARFLGLYGDPATTAEVAAEYKVFFELQRPNASGDYTVDHTAALYVIDRRGRPRLYVGGRRTVDRMVHDIKLLLRG